MALGRPIDPCPLCDEPAGRGRFCRRCGVLKADPASGAYVASAWTRAKGFLLEAALFVLTLGVGWLYWLYRVAPQSQTPAKAVLGLYVVDRSGRPASARAIWVRETVLVVMVVLGVAVTSLIWTVIDLMWVMLSADRQTIHDKVVSSVVVKPRMATAGQAAPAARDEDDETGSVGAYRDFDDREARLRELRDLLDQGLITDADYQRRRQRLLDE